MDKSENEYISEEKSFFGYYLPLNALNISLIAIFSALILVLTILIPIPIPATQGYLNIGDAGVMIAGLLFGPIVGGIAGGIGSMLGDIILPYYQYAPVTLIVKGLEGFVVGLISDPKRRIDGIDFKDVIAVILAGIIMVFGYFIYEVFLIGFSAAFYELFFNMIQYIVGIITSLLFAYFFRNNLIESFPQVFDKVYKEDTN